MPTRAPAASADLDEFFLTASSHPGCRFSAGANSLTLSSSPAHTSQVSNLIRFGVSLDEKILATFDQLITRKGYQNRSEAIRNLIRNQLVGEEWGRNKETVGTITLA